MARKRVDGGFTSFFVTVGTTSFDELMKGMDSEDFLVALKKLGCTELTVQRGRGNYVPSVLQDACSRHGVAFDCYRFKPTLTDDMNRADVIISHCGAGSVLESVSLRKFLIVVVNTTLQGNHQTELADAMAGQGWCISTEPQRLLGDLEDLATAGNLKNRLKPYPEADPTIFSGVVDSLFEF
jgi:beta-1,4-N-acetylglucosaminyltransferase